jgi:protein phosphatase
MEIFSAIDIGPVRDNQEDSMLVGENLFVVSDGIGGNASGELASKAVIDSFIYMGEGTLKVGDMDNTLDKMQSAVVSANIECINGKDDRGATCTAIYLVAGDNDDRLCLYVHVGDSRLYHISNGFSKQITNDHGQGHVLYNCVGIKNMYVDRGNFIVSNGDILVLCSDGVSDVLYKLDIADITRESKSPANGLVRRAIKEDTRDNCTAIVIKL